jgi:hypothetical protein
MGGVIDWTHVGSICASGLAGGGPGGGRRRGNRGASGAARFLAKCGAELGHVWPWGLEWSLGKSFEWSVGHGHERRRELTGNANGGRWRPVCALSRARERRVGVLKVQQCVEVVSPRIRVHSGDGMAWRRLRCVAGQRPMAEGGARSGVCAAAAWHRSRGGYLVTPRRRTVPMASGLRLMGLPVSRRAHAGVWRRADVACAARRREGAGAPAQTSSKCFTLN